MPCDLRFSFAEADRSRPLRTSGFRCRGPSADQRLERGRRVRAVCPRRMLQLRVAVSARCCPWVTVRDWRDGHEEGRRWLRPASVVTRSTGGEALSATCWTGGSVRITLGSEVPLTA